MKYAAAFFGASGVLLGALGAHALKEVLEPSELASFKTGVQYQLIHALALLASGYLKPARWVHWCWTLGIIFFSFSIYALVLDQVMGIDLSFLGPITPIGGLLFVAGWVGIALPAKSQKSHG